MFLNFFGVVVHLTTSEYILRDIWGYESFICNYKKYMFDLF